MGAAFGGSIVEKNINKSALLSAVLFSIGLITTSFGLFVQNIWLIYIGYGVLCGIAQGIGYLTPVKTLLMWFPNHKGLATAISIISFGLGSGFCTLLHKIFYCSVGIISTFQILAGIYFVMMLIGGLLIKKPYKETEIKTTQKFSYKNVLKDRFFICSWIFMFLNISAGLSLIGSSVNIFKELNISENIIVVLMVLAGLFNGGFRLVFAWISDILKYRLNIWLIISILSIGFMTCSIAFPLSLVFMVVLINATYGGGFSTVPSILSEKYDITCLSRVHGLVLSAWGIAGLIGNNISTVIYSVADSFLFVPYVLLIMYCLNMFIVLYMKKSEKYHRMLVT
jgi:OFA family oxalate/formate antiporter-like MFS transporter